MITADDLCCAQQAARELTSKIISCRKQALQDMKDVKADPGGIMHILRGFCRQVLA